MRELLAGLVPGLPRDAVKAIVARADGIPLYAVETVRMLVADGRLVRDDGVYVPTGDLDDLAVPETLTASSRPLDALEPADRALVSDAAVLGQSFTPAALARCPAATARPLETRLAALVRRELLRRETDPRSPERGQYAFVQALIREVAYNTLSRKDRKTRHLAAARYFESLGTDELAGALASHYLAAYRLAGDGPRPSARHPGTARTARRRGTRRRARLATTRQLTFYLEAASITPDVGERGDLLEKASDLAGDLDNSDLAIRLCEDALTARRELGDVEKILLATNNLAALMNVRRGDTKGAYALVKSTMDEFPDALETPSGARMMFIFGGMTGVLGDDATRLAMSERGLRLAERFDKPDAGRQRTAQSLCRIGQRGTRHRGGDPAARERTSSR